MKLREISFSLSTNLFLINLCIFKLTLKKDREIVFTIVRRRKGIPFYLFPIQSVEREDDFRKINERSEATFFTGLQILIDTGFFSRRRHPFASTIYEVATGCNVL